MPERGYASLAEALTTDEERPAVQDAGDAARVVTATAPRSRLSKTTAAALAASVLLAVGFAASGGRAIHHSTTSTAISAAAVAEEGAAAAPKAPAAPATAAPVDAEPALADAATPEVPAEPAAAALADAATPEVPAEPAAAAPVDAAAATPADAAAPKAPAEPAAAAPVDAAAAAAPADAAAPKAPAEAAAAAALVDAAAAAAPADAAAAPKAPAEAAAAAAPVDAAAAAAPADAAAPKAPVEAAAAAAAAPADAAAAPKAPAEPAAAPVDAAAAAPADAAAPKAPAEAAAAAPDAAAPAPDAEPTAAAGEAALEAPPADAKPLEAKADFDCEAGYSNWAAGWSAEKKAFCCEKEQKGCEAKEDFDCEAGYSNWAAGWSAEKKKACCEKEQKGCEGAPATKPADGILPACEADLKFCPREWADGPTGGFYCPADDGCAAAATGPFDPEACPGQCVIGTVPADVLEKLKQAADKDEDKTEAEGEAGADSANASGIEKPEVPAKKGKGAALTAEDNGGIPFCPDDVEDCPSDWRDGPEGGYLCNKGDQAGACQPWKAGPFDKKTCTDFCAIGAMPTTSTTTSTVTTVTTTTKQYEFPALICYSVARYGEEMTILNFQHDHSAGIFGCDETIVFADDPGTMNGGFPLTELPVKTGSGGGWSKDGTAANTEVFLMAWEGIKKDGRWEQVDWAVKADPDAVVLADRFRIQLKDATGSATYVKNCNKYDGPDWPLMFGAAEAISKQALARYWEGAEQCRKELEWQSWGEDYFLSHCLDHLGVNAFLDTDEIGDALCTGAVCSEGGKAAFHPFKSVGAWEQCWREATGQQG